MPRHYQPFVSQIRPTLATLPNFASELTKPAAPAVALKYAPPDFVSQIRPTLATLPSLTSELTKPAAPPVTLRYARPDFVNQVRPTLAALPLLAAADFTPVSLRAQPLDFVQCDVQMQANPTLAALPLLASSDFVPASQKSQPQVYRVCDWTSQARPTLAMLPRIVAGTAEPAANAQPLKYDVGSYAAPAKFGLVTQATPTLASWTANTGAPAIVLKYALPHFVNQIAPTLGTLPPSVAFLNYIPPIAQPQEFDRGGYVAPDKFGITVAATPTVASWTATVGSPAQPQDFDKGSFALPDKSVVAAATPSPAGWTNYSDRWSAIKLRTALPDSYLAPVRVLPFIENVTIDKWRQIEPPPAYRARFWPSQTFTGPVMSIAFVPPPGPFVGFARITVNETMTATFSMRGRLSASTVTTSALVAKRFTVVGIS